MLSSNTLKLCVFALVLAAPAPAHAFNTDEDNPCGKLEDCVAQLDPGDANHKLRVRWGVEQTDVNLGLIRPNESIDFDFDKWMWSKWDSGIVGKNHPTASYDAYKLFSKLMVAAVNCVNQYSSRDYKSNHVSCKGDDAKALSKAIEEAKADTYLGALEIVHFPGGHSVRSPLLGRLGIPGFDCPSASSCTVEHKRGWLAEREHAVKTAARPEGRDAKRVPGGDAAAAPAPAPAPAPHGGQTDLSP